MPAVSILSGNLRKLWLILNSSGSGDKKELSIETRLLLAFILMGAVLFTTPYFFKIDSAAAGGKEDGIRVQVSGRHRDIDSPVGLRTHRRSAARLPGRAPGVISAQKEETFTVETDLYKIVFSNRGAVVRSWILKNYH